MEKTIRFRDNEIEQSLVDTLSDFCFKDYESLAVISIGGELIQYYESRYTNRDSHAITPIFGKNGTVEIKSIILTDLLTEEEIAEDFMEGLDNRDNFDTDPYAIIYNPVIEGNRLSYGKIPLKIIITDWKE